MNSAEPCGCQRAIVIREIGKGTKGLEGRPPVRVKEAANWGSLLSRHAAAFGPQQRALGEIVVIVGDPKHDRLGFGILDVFGEMPQLFGALSPMPRIVRVRE